MTLKYSILTQKYLPVKDPGKIFLYLFAAALYLPMIITNVLSGLLILYLILRWREISLRHFARDPVLIGFVLLYSLILLGVFYPIPGSYVWVDLEKKFSLLVLPLGLYAIQPDRKDLKRSLAVFYYMGLFVTSAAFLYALVLYARDGNMTHLTNHGLSQKIGFHATYLSMYLAFSLTYLLHCSRNIGFKLYLSAAMILIYLMLLNSRITLIVLLLGIIFIGTRLIYKKRWKIKHSVLVAAGILIISLSTVLVSPVRERLLEAINYDDDYQISNVWGGRGVRMLIWNSSLELMSEKPLTGYGASSAIQKALDSTYFEKEIGPIRYMMNQGTKFNPHSQFLSEFLKFGILLGLCYIAWLAFLFYYFGRFRNWAGIFLVLLISGVSLTETVFELNKGIVFITYFIPLTYLTQWQNSVNTETKHG